MIFVGKRQVGKTYMAMKTLSEKCKKGDVIGIIARNLNVGNYLKRIFINSFIKDDSFVFVKLIEFEDINSVDYVLIDDLDFILGGDKCFCTSGGVIELERTDKEYIDYINNIKDEYTFTKKENKITLRKNEEKVGNMKNEQKLLDLKESVILDLSRMELSDNLALFSAIQTLCDIEMAKKAILNSVQVKFDDGSYMNLDIKNNIDSLVQEMRNYFEIITKNIKDGEC